MPCFRTLLVPLGWLRHSEKGPHHASNEAHASSPPSSPGAMPGLTSFPLAQDRPLEIAMLIPGRIDDGGFMQAGYDGLVAIRDELGAETRYIDGIAARSPRRWPPPCATSPPRARTWSSPTAARRRQGRRGRSPPEFPDVRFTVVQGALTGPNVASYEVLQEQSAWLAGAAAGLLTETGVVGHISGIRAPPGSEGPRRLLPRPASTPTRTPSS